MSRLWKVSLLLLQYLKTQESVASGFVLTGESFSPTEIPGALIFIKEGAEDLWISI